jgi:hypothetical protein
METIVGIGLVVLAIIIIVGVGRVVTQNMPGR